MKKYLAIFLGIFIFSQTCYEVSAEEALELSAKTSILMEAETGKVLYEKEADQALPPASVTKVMTLLLIFDALDEGKITLEDEVTTSEYAASMGGSQVFLEPGEKQTVETMIKCIAVASANDACVAMEEKISGTEELFVQQMNKRAAELGMKNTNFVNCNGLDADGHVTSARDIALMSRELILSYPQIFQYTQIWMENITHVTAKGSSEFGLTNTNKLIRQYEYATGLKTGSTSGAGFCLSGTAEKDGIQMIAVVMGEPDSKTRTKDVIAMLKEAGVQPTAMMDVSDGLSSELLHICKQSNVGCRIYEDRIPIDYQTAIMAEEMNMNLVTAAMNGGEDYELLFTVPLTDHDKVVNMKGVRLIGRITKPELGAYMVTRDSNEIAIRAQGWNAFTQEDAN